MRLTALVLAPLLFACSQESENAASNAHSQPEGQASEIVNRSAPSGRPSPSGEAAPQSSDEISLQASPQQVNAGTTVQLMLVNGTQQPLGYNLCTSTIQAPDGSAVRTDRVCTMELRILQPGESTTYPLDLPGVLEDGSYHISTSVERMGSGERSTVTSNPIQID